MASATGLEAILRVGDATFVVLLPGFEHWL
jgi:hypothetical protein